MAKTKHTPAKLDKIRGVSPIGTAMWTDNLYEKDTKFCHGDESKAKFKGYISFPKGDAAAEEWIQARMSRHVAVRGNDEKCPVRDGDDKERQAKAEDVEAGLANEVGEYIDDERLNGMWYVVMTTKAQPEIIDAFKRAVTPDVAKVMGGDKIRMAFSENIIERGDLRGVYLYLDGVQLIEKRNTGVSAASRFDVVDDGFQVPEVGSDDGVPAAASGDF
jgi:hypothetical protein